MWRLAEAEHGRLRLAIVLAALGVLAGMLPYFVVAKLVTTLLSRTAAGPRFYIFMCFAAFAGYTLRSLFYASALAVSHRAAFAVLRSIRTQVFEKLPKLPLGVVIDTQAAP